MQLTPCGSKSESTCVAPKVKSNDSNRETPMANDKKPSPTRLLEGTDGPGSAKSNVSGAKPDHETPRKSNKLSSWVADITGSDEPA